jgi:hypothetical protein
LKPFEVEPGIFQVTQELFFLVGSYGNFLLGLNDELNQEMIRFFAGHGGVMKSLNPFEKKGEKSHRIFDLFGSTEVLFHGDFSEHPYEQWGKTFYHHHFQELRHEGFCHLFYFKNSRSYLFLDPKISIAYGVWIIDGSRVDAYNSLEQHIEKADRVFSFNQTGFEESVKVSKTDLQNKLS